MRTVSNTSPISNLAYIGRLDLLQLQFNEIWIPEVVGAELQNVPDTAAKTAIKEAQQAGWIKSQTASNKVLIGLLMNELHAGEAEAIALAIEMKADRLLMDEREGRLMASQAGLPVTGVLGILLRAKKTGHLKMLKSEVDALKNKARFFISPDLETAVLTKAGELK